MNIQIKLTKKQRDFIKDKSKRNIGICGRRGGKTFTVMTDILDNLQKGNQEFIYVTDTRKHAEEIFWEPFKTLIPRQWISKISESKLNITTINNTLIKVRGANYYDSLVGGLNHRIYIDEAQLVKEKAWTEALQPTLLTTNGDCIVTGTPITNTWVESYMNKEGWSSYHWTTAEGGIVPLEAIEEAKRELDDRTFRSQYLAEFTTSEGAIFYAFDDNNIVDVEFNPNDTLYLSFDFNVNPMTCVLFQNDIAIKEFEVPDSNTTDISNRILKYLQEKKFSSQIFITGDHTGNARNPAATTTNYRIMRDIFVDYLPVREYPIKTRHCRSVEDRFNTTNTAFCSFDGVRKLFVNKDCTKLIKYLKSVNRVDYKGDPNGVTHLTDAFTYYAFNFLPIKSKLYTI